MEEKSGTKPTPHEEASTYPEKICFVVMPFGRNQEERRWFKGWYEVVIQPSVAIAGYRPILAATEEQPGAINDEIRAHLAFDPMVVVDLGGTEPDDDPNSNVMYELGIRHAFGMPLVMMAWEGQQLPFDVSNQRVIMEQRDLLSIDTNKKKLTSFIRAASEGRYYRPMDAVSRRATIEAASASLGEDSILGALVQEVRDLRGTVASAAFPKHLRTFRQTKPTIKRALRGKVFRKELYPHFLASGGSTKLWPRVLKTEVSEEFMEGAEKWGVVEWKNYITQRVNELSSSDIHHVHNGVEVDLIVEEALSESDSLTLTESLIEQVRAELPEQPWPTGVHKVVCAKFGISSKTYDRVVNELIMRGIFQTQINGKLIDQPAKIENDS